MKEDPVKLYRSRGSTTLVVRLVIGRCVRYLVLVFVRVEGGVYNSHFIVNEEDFTKVNERVRR